MPGKQGILYLAAMTLYLVGNRKKMGSARCTAREYIAK